MNIIKAIDVIDRLPLELASALQCDAFFDDIPVVIAERGNVAQEIQRLQAATNAKNGKWGVFVVVLQLTADDTYPNIAFGSLKLKPAFQVGELPTQNNSPSGTGKSARKVARKIRDVIKPLELLGLCSCFVFEEDFLKPVPSQNPALVLYQVECHTYEADQENISQVAAPQFTLTDNGTTLTLTSATEGAVIYFTTDLSFPAPASKVPASTAQVYSSPIPIPAAGFIVRAAAWDNAGSIGSIVTLCNTTEA